MATFNLGGLSILLLAPLEEIHRLIQKDARPLNSGIFSAIIRPISKEAVAAGEGALHTWIVDESWMIRKSSTRLPSGRRAWARTPAPPGTRSLAEISGMSLRRLRTNAFLLKDRCNSFIPDLACLAARRQNPL